MSKSNRQLRRSSEAITTVSTGPNRRKRPVSRPMARSKKKKLRFEIPTPSFLERNAILGCRGPLNGELFLKYVQQELAPNLRSGDIFVLDNLQTHKVSGVVEAVQARDARVLYLPPYSPDFNPIEQVFSKIKNELRRRELRTIDALENAFGESLDWITKTDALHFFQNSGYAKQ